MEIEGLGSLYVPFPLAGNFSFIFCLQSRMEESILPFKTIHYLPMVQQLLHNSLHEQEKSASGENQEVPRRRYLPRL